MKKITVTVPATSANLGPGYDCLGMALSLYMTLTAEPSDTLCLTGCPKEYQNEENLVYRAFSRAFEKAGEKVPGVHLDIRTDVPVARGLGSSSACIVGGLLTANILLNERFTKEELFSMAAEMEGHPDNAAPCLYGGLTAAFVEDGSPRAVRFCPHADWRFIALIPDYEVRTEEARRVVRQDKTIGESVYAMSHAVAMVHALETGDGELLGLSCRDVLHEPYRRKLIPDYDKARETALSHGADAFFISGSGSTLMSAAKAGRASREVAGALCAAFPRFAVRELSAVPEGASAVLG